MMREGMERTPGDATGDVRRLDGELGFQYFKFTQERADAAWEQIHTITRWNYTAFGAASVALGTQYADAALRKALLPSLAAFVFVASLAAALLAWMHVNNALYLYGYAHQLEKDWLRGKPTKDMIPKIETLRRSVYRMQADRWPRSVAAVRGMFSNIHFWTNVLPAFVAVGAVVAWLKLR